MRKRLTVSTSRSAGLLVLAALWAIFLAMTGSAEAILFTIPVFLMVAPLAIGRYVGEGAIAALRRRSRRRVTVVAVIQLGSVAEVLRGRIDATLAAGRGPPSFTH